MFKTLFQNTTPFFKVIFSGLIMVVSFIVVFFLGILLYLICSNTSFEQILTIFNNNNSLADNINLLKYVQGLNTAGLFIIPAFIIAYFFGNNLLSFLHLKLTSRLNTIFLVIISMFIALPLINYLAEINSNMQLPGFLHNLEIKMRNAEDNAQYITNLFVNVNSFSGYIFNLFIIAILPAIGEELIFRAVFQKFFISWTKNIHIGVLFAAILFSAFHFQFYGFLPRMLLGLYFGYLLIWSKSVWVPIIAHFINNATAVTFYYLHNIKFVNVDIENIGTEKNESLVVLLSCFLLFIVIFSIYRFEKQNRNKINYEF
ncbi:MAG: CPBP family intramembrane metalloprotease [Chlorobi bacterium]|nr:CPBP family intramembrane metalloprotease [Chlorobiota bacterium]